MKAIFFDLDGVLINSEIMHQEMTREFLEQEHYDVPLERFHLLIGSHKSLNPWPKVFEGIELPISVEEFRQRLRAFKDERFKTIDYATIVFPEVREALLELKKRGFKIACASSSNIEYIKTMLQSGQLFSLFDLVVSCDNFERSKPAPDIYQYCQNYFGFAAEDCMVVEDSEIGIQAGKRAGMKTIARKDYNFHLNQSEADDFIDDLNDLLALIDKPC